MLEKIKAFMTSLLLSIFINVGAYTEQRLTMNACKLFAEDAVIASGHLQRRAPYTKIKQAYMSLNIAPSKKDRMLEAIDLVYFNYLDNFTMAYTIALSNCLPPKVEMAPIDEPYAVSPRALKNPL